jgi:hypothetical protein
MGICLVRIVDLDLHFKSPQKDARIIGAKGDKTSSSSPTTVVKKACSITLGEEYPFISPQNMNVLGKKRAVQSRLAKIPACRFPRQN